ncbi:SDR family oxidoreductase [Parachitinimonas caeni]|uniref:SDR family oxidoreductase n=1 Tax=Parachitinimonas caeni TaxID=3031301 RepID=A0ABT7DSQ7_9NEIS|nr:SDR family oxidoreductase [Parachitinimonas caeni]MDK2123103.1 SDR family oxidoreductase [Parachitinimonas caeni]
MNTLSNYAGKTAVVTGGNSGIGLATARLLRQHGAKVAICGRDQASLQAAAQELGVLAVEADISRHADIDRLYATVSAELGPIDFLFANAGVFQAMSLADTTEAFFDWQFDINAKGVFFTVQKALPYLRDGASIVLMSSTIHDAGWADCSVYAASKAAVRSMARSFSAELLPRGIRVNAIAPGITDTPILEWPGMNPEERAAAQDGFRSRVPMGRFAQPEEMAEAVLFLGSPASAYMAGGVLRVDGGLMEL